MPVVDMDTALSFYTGVLTFNKVSDNEFSGQDVDRRTGLSGARVRVVRLQLGDEFIELRQFLTPPGKPYPSESSGNDRWFQHVAIVVGNMDDAYAALSAAHVQSISMGPQQFPDWNVKAGGIRAFYFKDPDGHPLEIIWFPDGKGAAKWHRFTPPLFMGIDHTAIVVASTPQSLAFYRDELGLNVAADSDNSGIEQERLSNVEHAHVQITSLRADAGPGVEFLDYVAPLDGKPAPADEAINDEISSQIAAHRR